MEIEELATPFSLWNSPRGNLTFFLATSETLSGWNKWSVKYFKPFSGARAHVAGSHCPHLPEDHLSDEVIAAHKQVPRVKQTSSSSICFRQMKFDLVVQLFCLLWSDKKNIFVANCWFHHQQQTDAIAFDSLSRISESTKAILASRSRGTHCSCWTLSN